MVWRLARSCKSCVFAALSSAANSTKLKPQAQPVIYGSSSFTFVLLRAARPIMASIIRSNDSLFTAHQGGRAGSAVSALDRLAEARQVTQLSAIVGNGAHDGALQINGHVTDKINNLNWFRVTFTTRKILTDQVTVTILSFPVIVRS